MGFYIKKNKLVFFSLASINLMIAVAAVFLLPKRFFYDSIIIVKDQYNEIGLFGSYPFAILFYYITGLRYLPYFLVALIQYPILVFILYKLGIPNNFHKLNVKNILVYLGFVMMAMFISMPSKEFITFTYTSMIPFVLQSEKIKSQYKPFICFGLFIILGVFFRVYFLLVPVLAVAMYFFSFINISNRVARTITYGVLLAVFLSILYGSIKGEYLSASRQEVNSTRTVNQDANTMISPLIPPTTWYGEAIAIVYGFISVNFPVEGFKHILHPHVIAFIFWQFAVIYILLVRFSKSLANRQKYRLLMWNFLLLFGYFIVQGMFEPDLGGSIKHKMGLFPLIYYAFYYEHFRKELQ